jgi:hypothetical protein
MLELSKDNKQSTRQWQNVLSLLYALDWFHNEHTIVCIPLGYPNRSGESSSEERCMVQERRDFLLEKLTQKREQTLNFWHHMNLIYD